MTPSPDESARYSGAENLSWSRRHDHISLGCCQFLLATPHVTVLSAWSHQCTCASTILKVLGTAKSAGSAIGGSYPCMIWSVFTPAWAISRLEQLKDYQDSYPDLLGKPN